MRAGCQRSQLSTWSQCWDFETSHSSHFTSRVAEGLETDSITNSQWFHQPCLQDEASMSILQDPGLMNSPESWEPAHMQVRMPSCAPALCHSPCGCSFTLRDSPVMVNTMLSSMSCYQKPDWLKRLSTGIPTVWPVGQKYRTCDWHLKWEAALGDQVFTL